MKKVIAAGMAAVLLCLSQTGCSSGKAAVDEVVDQAVNVVQTENENVLAVKGGQPVAYPGKTYEEAFGSFFGSPTWKYFVGTKEGPDDDGDGKPDYTEENIDIVEFTGYCMYMNVNVKARIQFTLNKENNTFDTTYLSFNDVPQNNLTLWALLDKAFTGGDTVPESEAGQDGTAVSASDEPADSGAGGESAYAYPYMYYAGDYSTSDPSGYCELLLYAPGEGGEIGTIDIKCELTEFKGTVYDFGTPDEYVVIDSTWSDTWYLVFYNDEPDPYFELQREGPAAADYEMMVLDTFYMTNHYEY